MGENLYCFFIDSSHIASLPLDIYLFAVPLPKTQVTNRTLSCGFFFFLVVWFWVFLVGVAVRAHFVSLQAASLGIFIRKLGFPCIQRRKRGLIRRYEYLPLDSQQNKAQRKTVES